MRNAIYRNEDPTLESAELGALYRFHAPHTGGHWGLYKISDDCGVDSVEALEVPDGWEDAFEYEMADTRIWRRITSLAFEADLAHAILEIAFVPFTIWSARLLAQSLCCTVSPGPTERRMS